jgi:plastocyanin
MSGNAITMQMVFQPSSVHVLDSFTVHWLTPTNQSTHKVAIKAFRYPEQYDDSERMNKVRDTTSAYMLLMPFGSSRELGEKLEF